MKTNECEVSAQANASEARVKGASPAVANKPIVKIENVGQTFSTKSGKFTALRDINLDVSVGEVVTLIGHSGCGKSTLLNLIAGLSLPTSGLLLCDGREIAGPGPERSVVFQNHSLLPWMTCFENVMLGVERVFGRKEGVPKLKARVAAALDMVHMDHAMHKYPHEISGGMKQRVGIARAFAMEPKLLLMDEPFGALDALTRAALQDELNGVMAKTGATVVMVTHDVDEAVLLSDRIVMMTNGPAATIGEIVEVKLERPRDRLELAQDTRFADYRAAVFEFLYRKQLKRAA
ncbi:MAG: ABC transporter ATP-binding protein [Sulfuritalea sp.]|nr:ABC transporter ATP-binding protein [Sulfuritalea sp.]